jgi:heme-degrading monooxygenase HmoA
MMSGSRGCVRVMLFLRTSDPLAIEKIYHQISADLNGTPGLLRNELLRDLDDAGSFVVLSEWQSRAAFGSWERGAGHRGTTAPLRRYQDTDSGRPFGVYEVTASYGS